MVHRRPLSNGDVNGPIFDDARPAKSLVWPHSHSIVPGGFDVTSSTTRLPPLTSLMMRVAVSPRKPHVESIDGATLSVRRKATQSVAHGQPMERPMPRSGKRRQKLGHHGCDAASALQLVEDDVDSAARVAPTISCNGTPFRCEGRPDEALVF